ncbi:hypothetical protein ASG45_13620 [Microbacterium sp. Leaf436]|nr:hypothetical protein ASG45_13620 [Microbacterium sp. Leaf436]
MLAFARDFPEAVEWSRKISSDDLGAWVFAHVSLLVADEILVSSKVSPGFALAGPVSREDAAKQIMPYLTDLSLADAEERALLFSARGAILRYAALYRVQEMGLLEGFYYLAGRVDRAAA